MTFSTMKNEQPTLLKGFFVRGNFGQADDFLQTLFARDDENTDENEELFGDNKVFYDLGFLTRTRGRFLQRDLHCAL
jgi:hypothetical protein